MYVKCVLLEFKYLSYKLCINVFRFDVIHVTYILPKYLENM